MSRERAGYTQDTRCKVENEPVKRIRVTRTVVEPYKTVQIIERQTSASDSNHLVGNVATHEVKRGRTSSEPVPGQMVSYHIPSQNVTAIDTAQNEIRWDQGFSPYHSKRGVIEQQGQHITSNRQNSMQSSNGARSDQNIESPGTVTQVSKLHGLSSPENFSYSKDIRIISGQHPGPVTLDPHHTLESKPRVNETPNKYAQSRNVRVRYQPAQITSANEKNGDKCFVVTASTIPTKLEHSQVPRGLSESGQEYKPARSERKAQYCSEDKHVSESRNIQPNLPHSGSNATSLPNSLYKEVQIFDSNSEAKEIQRRPLSKEKQSNSLSGTIVSSKRNSDTLYEPSSDAVIRSKIETKRSVPTLQRSDTSNGDNEKPVTVHTLHLEDWKKRCSGINEIESDLRKPGTVHTLCLDTDLVETDTLAAKGAYQGTLVHNPSGQDTDNIKTGNVHKLKQIFGKRKKDEYNLQYVTPNKHRASASKTLKNGTQTLYGDRKEVVICPELEPEVHKKEETAVYQVPVINSLTSQGFKEVDPEQRRLKRKARRSSSCSSVSSLSESSGSTMGNEQQRLANADVTVEEDGGGNKMIVIEGKNIRLHSDKYETGKKGAQRVVLMNETNRSGEKTFIHDADGSVNSYDSYDKHGRKEKMVVVNGHLGNEVSAVPLVKVARITSPSNVTTERHITVQRNREFENGVEYERGIKAAPVKMTTLNVINHQGNDRHDDRVDGARLPNLQESILLFEKPQHQKKVKVTSTVGVTRQGSGGQHTPGVIKRVVIQKQMGVPASESRKEVERRVIKVANSNDLAKSLQGNEVILQKSPPPNRRVKETEVKVVKPSYYVQTSREDHVDSVRSEEHKQSYEVQTRSRTEHSSHNDDNVFNTNYYIRRENPIYAEIDHQKQKEHKLVIQKSSTEEPIYSQVNKVRTPVHVVKTEILLKKDENAPIVHKEEKQVMASREIGSEQVTREIQQETRSVNTYGLSALLAKEHGAGEQQSVNQTRDALDMREKVQSTTYETVSSTQREIQEEVIRPTVHRQEEVQNTTIIRNLENFDQATTSNSAEDERTVHGTGTASHSNYSLAVDNTTASTNQANFFQSNFFENEKHSTHWLIPDVSNRSGEYSESTFECSSSHSMSDDGVSYRSDITIQPKEHQVFIASIPLQLQNELTQTGSGSKWLSKKVYYINIKDDTPLDVNLEPKENVLDIGYGGIYIEDVHPHVETIYIRDSPSKERDSDTESIRSMYCTELDLDKRLSCLLPGWRCEEDEDVLKHIDVHDDEEDMETGVIQKETGDEIQVERGSILIKNSMMTANGPKYVDVVDGDDEVEEAPEIDDNSNVFDHHFHVNRENPLYSSDTETQEETRNVREQFAPHNMYGRSAGGRSGYSSSGYKSSSRTRSRKVNNDYDPSGLIFSIPKAVFRSHFDRPRHGSASDETTDLLLNNAKLPDHFFYTYEGNTKRKKLLGTEERRVYDNVDGEEDIQATIVTDVSSERQSLEEIARSRQRRVRPVSNTVQQHVHVDHEEEEVRGEPHLCHADGTNAESADLLTFDTVSEDVHLGVKDGVAQVEVKVRCERVTPIEASFNMWRKSAVIITRLIHIDLEVTDERRELYHKIMNNEVPGRGMIEDGVSRTPSGEVVLDKKQTYRVYSALMGIADEDEKEALAERRPSKLLSLGSGVPEESVHDIHQFVKKSKAAKSPRLRHKKKKQTVEMANTTNYDHLLY